METEESFETNLTTLKEMILDDEKLVTYVSLSKDLCIHINTSKKLLRYIVTNIPEQFPNVKLNVNYIISGITDGNKAQTTVCTEDVLQNLKKSLKTIFYEHVYSVSKGSPHTDHAAYLLLSKFEDFSLCAGLIKNSECIKHTSDEIGNLKSNSQEAVSIENKALANPQKKIESESKNVTNLLKSSQKVGDKTNVEDSEKLKTKIKSEVVSPTKETNNNKQNSIKSNNNNNKTQKGIAGFFNKSSTTQKKVLKEPENKPNTMPKDSIKIKEENMEVDIENHKSDSEKDVKNKPNSNKKNKVDIENHMSDSEKDTKNKPNSNNKNKVPNQVKKASKVDKKRKRILLVSDTDSDEENDPFAERPEKQELKNESDDEIPPTPSVDSIKITSGLVNPKKRRKVVDKTYTDEDGYILTKKEEIYESCSDNEEDVDIKQNVKEVKLEKVEISPKSKKNGVTSTKKKISPPQKGKQTTLAHFFTKK